MIFALRRSQGSENASSKVGSALSLIWESPISINSLNLASGRLELIQDAHTLVALVDSEERCLRRLSMKMRFSLETIAFFLRGVHLNTTLTKSTIVSPGLQEVAATFGDMLRHNDILEELCIDSFELRNDDAAATLQVWKIINLSSSESAGASCQLVDSEVSSPFEAGANHRQAWPGKYSRSN